MTLDAQNEKIYEKRDIDSDFMKEIYFSIIDKGTCRGKNRTYINDFMTMDIETTTVNRETEPIAFAYSIAVYIAKKCIVFRTWTDYNWFINELNYKFGLTNFYRFVCYVHNLPYEFQFMRDFMHIEEVFATQPRKVVKCLSNCIEYRCSYKLTNMGLARFTSTIPNIKHGKLSGEDFDYSKLRTPTTTLSPSELSYIHNDVAGLYEALDYTIRHDEYNIANIPNTSTGFVRNELRYEMSRNPENRHNFLETQLNQLTYGLLRTARRGGNTHCNPVWSNMEIPGVTSMDMSSAYPAVMVECKFPMTQFMPIPQSRLTDYESYIDEGYACILDITFYDLEVFNCDTIPYIAKAHVTGFPKLKKGDKESDFRSDNGRVLKARKLSMVITDIDYKIIRDTYRWDKSRTECRLCFVAQYDYLPLELRRTLLKQYRDKTTLKDQDPYMYMKQKNKFNANFGCMLTDICQDKVEYVEGSTEPFKLVKEASFEEQLTRYYSSRNSFLSYQHGVWVTAHCRARLQKAIDELKYDMIYCDTDSVKFIDTSANRLLFEKLNDDIRKDIKDCGLNCSVEYKGKTYTLGVWEPDGDYKSFKSMGAKKYCYIDNDDKFHITVAGLSKSKARDYLQSKGGMDAFDVGTIVPKEHSGRTTATYNDYDKAKTITIGDETIVVGSNMVIEDTTYQFTITEDYENLLQNIIEGVMW
jgi:hypothetical protein